MKVLITGKNSYIGTKVKEYLQKFDYEVDELDTIGDEWKTFDYSQYEVVVHVAAIVHDDAKSASEKLFEKVNTELPVEIAKLAKNSGTKQFVFFSTMAVFGVDKSLDPNNVVDFDTPLNPTTMYGKTKLNAEKMLQDLEGENFKVAVVRPPNVYGKNCRGNYMPIFLKIVKKSPVFPYAFNDIKQSFIYIDNLSCLVKLIIESNSDGIFMPQDNKALSTVELVQYIGYGINKKIRYSRFLGTIISKLKNNSYINKLYGGVQYSQKVSNCFNNKYQIVDTGKGIKKTFQTSSDGRK